MYATRLCFSQQIVLRFCARMIFFASEHDNAATNALVAALADAGAVAARVDPAMAAELARPGDLVVGRVDVLPDVSGIAPGLSDLERAAACGATVLNSASALVAAHDKLLTAERFAERGVPHPRTEHVDAKTIRKLDRFPLVVKPRFGSWGRDVVLVSSRAELEATAKLFARRPWFRADGAIAQEYIDTREDLRVLVCCGSVVGAVSRVARPGEWRTNVALGARRRPALPDLAAQAVAVAAAAAVEGDLVAVDLLPSPSGWLALEVNGAADFNQDYGLNGEDVFARIATLLMTFAQERAAAVQPAADAATAGIGA
jgi:RimK family alpha-L-glutamate ligase